MEEKKLTPEGELMYRIIENWGNVVAMPQMEGWIKEYGDKRAATSLIPGPPTETGTYFAVIKPYVGDEPQRCVLHYQAHKNLYRAAGHAFNIIVQPEDVVGYIGEVKEQAGIKQINREWINDALVEFTLAYHKSANKDVSNDSAEYLDDKLKDAGIEYVLSEGEVTAAGREDDAVAFAEWVAINNWVLRNDITTWHWGPIGIPKEEWIVCTSSELYVKFKQQKDK